MSNIDSLNKNKSSKIHFEVYCHKPCQNMAHENCPRMGLSKIISSCLSIIPTPDGVPVYIRSPGNNSHTVLKKEMIWGIEKIMSFVFPSYRFSPFTKHVNGILNKSNESS